VEVAAEVAAKVEVRTQVVIEVQVRTQVAMSIVLMPHSLVGDPALDPLPGPLVGLSYILELLVTETVLEKYFKLLRQRGEVLTSNMQLEKDSK
jgi:hypothetical protein